MCPSPSDVRELAKWDGSAGSSRQRLLASLEALIPPSILLPSNRLLALLDQAYSFQVYISLKTHIFTCVCCAQMPSAFVVLKCHLPSCHLTAFLFWWRTHLVRIPIRPRIVSSSIWETRPYRCCKITAVPCTTRQYLFCVVPLFYVPLFVSSHSLLFSVSCHFALLCRCTLLFLSKCLGLQR